MTFGAFYVSGLQTGTPSGGQTSLGPFAIAFSECVDVQQISVPSADTIVLTPPTNPFPAGLWIIPPQTNTTPMVLKGADADTGFFISPNTPTFIAFDPANPSNNVITVGEGGVTFVAQYV